MLIARLVELAPLLGALGRNRPVFHSERDLQLALGWEIHQRGDGEIRVRLEVRTGTGIHLDVLAHHSATGASTALELKFMTQSGSAKFEGEQFTLLNHSARDQRRYDIVHDVQRVERYVRDHPGANGAVVVLTNDPDYWKPSSWRPANDAQFRISEGLTLGPRDLTWERPPAGKHRQAALRLDGTYELAWQDYSNVGLRMQLRQLVIEVPAGSPD